MHFSLLPKLRGAAPVQYAILGGLERTGVTTIRMDEGMDTGPILLQAEEAIDPEEDAGSLGDRLALLGGRLLVETLDGLAAGSIEGRIQDDASATFAPKLKPEDRMIDWSQSSEAVVRLVRAMSPAPGATTTFRGRRLKVLRAKPLTELSGSRRAEPSGQQPGHLAFTEEGMGVVTGTGLALLEEVQLEGRLRMSGAEFVRGYRPTGEERLGEVPGGAEPSG